jgi:hypothetical protein
MSTANQVVAQYVALGVDNSDLDGDNPATSALSAAEPVDNPADGLPRHQSHLGLWTRPTCGLRFLEFHTCSLARRDGPGKRMFDAVGPAASGCSVPAGILGPYCPTVVGVWIVSVHRGECALITTRREERVLWSPPSPH